MFRRDSPTVAAAKRGDEDAFRSLFRAVQPGLLRYLAATTGTGAAEDVAADTWVDVARGLPEFRGDDADFAAWVATIARRRRIDHLRAGGRDRSIAMGLPDRAAPEDVADQVEQVVSTERALALIGALPPTQAEVVLLRVVVGLDVARVAEVTGLTPGNVRVLQHRGLRRLRTLLGPDASDHAVTRQGRSSV
jgi:RNA polymerase sigma-70 factor (ECF subfamily)